MNPNFDRPLSFNAYDALAATTDHSGEWSNVVPRLAYYALGIGGESGEIVDAVKKLFRDHNGDYIQNGAGDKLLREIGDLLWYASRLAASLGSDLETVAEMNIEKLASRKERGKIHGSGDNR